MKKLFVLLVSVMVISLIACGSMDPAPTDPKLTSPTDPAPTPPTDPAPTPPTDPAPTSPTDPAPTSPTDPAPTSPTVPVKQVIQAGKDQILAVQAGLKFDNAAHIETINKYQKEYKSIVLSAADTNPFVTFTVDFDIASCSIVHVYDVTEKGAEYEITRSYYYYLKAQVEGNKIIVPVDFWITSDFMLQQRLDMIAYLLYVKDTNGVSHPYYFRVDYSAFEKLQGAIMPPLVGSKADGLVLDIKNVGYVYVKTTLEPDPSNEVFFEYYASDLKQAKGIFTDLNGNEQEYAYVLENAVTLFYYYY